MTIYSTKEIADMLYKTEDEIIDSILHNKINEYVIKIEDDKRVKYYSMDEINIIKELFN